MQSSPADAVWLVGTRPFGFPRESRLLSKADYGAVFGRGRRISDRYWTIIARGRDGDSCRLGLAIAKKRVRRAVDRNRLKRLVRESFRHRRAELIGCDAVVMVRDAAATASSAALAESLDRLWTRVARECRRR